MGAVVGIDLGTTNTVVAAVRDGRPVALPDESGSPLIPSIVSFLPSGAVLVGSAAKERRSEDPRNTIYSVKRLIGRTWDSPEVQQATTRFPFEMREGPGRATFVVARGETYTLPEISAFVLRKAKSIAELELGETVDRAVITVPANFNDLQRAATKVAGRVAGLEVLRILNEPTAAALAFGHSRGHRQRIAVYDFGGGTFDLTILLLTDDVFEVLATAGDTFLGGDDIDGAIVDRMASACAAATGDDPRAQPDTLERLRAAAEQIKLDLSNSDEAVVRLEGHEIRRPNGLAFSLSRSELEVLVDPVVARTFAVCRDALAMAKLTCKDIDHVLLVGGTTRIPLVKQRVEEYFGKRSRADLDPHEVVALGAAQQAMALTEVRATASGIPVAPPPRAAAAANPEANGSGESDEITQRRRFESIELLRKQTDPGVGDAGGGSPDETAAPGRMSVVPPDGPLTNPAPTTQNFGSRERKTTGIGLGPVADLPLVGVEPAPVTHEALDQTMPPSTLSGLGPKEKSASPGATTSVAATTSPTPTGPTPTSPKPTSPNATGAREPRPNPRSFATRQGQTQNPEPSSAAANGFEAAGAATNAFAAGPDAARARPRGADAAGAGIGAPSATKVAARAGAAGAAVSGHAASTDPAADRTAAPAIGSAAVTRPRRDFVREPTVRVTRGAANVTTDLSSTLTSAVAAPAPPAKPDPIGPGDPIFAAVVRPDAHPPRDATGQTGQIERTDPLFGAIVNPDPTNQGATGVTTASDRKSPTITGKSPRETLPDDFEPWLEPNHAEVDAELPDVARHPHPGQAHVGAASPNLTQPTQTRFGGATAGGDNSTDLLADLPIVVAFSPQGKVGTGESTARRPLPAADAASLPLVSNQAYGPRLGLPEPGRADLGLEEPDHEADEPTVIRRSAQSVTEPSFPQFRHEAATELDLPAPSPRNAGPELFDGEDLPAMGSSPSDPALPQRLGKTSSPNEEEIRARYGNLPLIVGGKRVGQFQQDRTVTPQRTASFKPEVVSPEPPPVGAEAATKPPAAIGSSPNDRHGVPAVGAATSHTVPAGGEPIAQAATHQPPAPNKPTMLGPSKATVVQPPTPLHPVASLAPEDLEPDEFEPSDEPEPIQLLSQEWEHLESQLEVTSPYVGSRPDPSPILAGPLPLEEPPPKSSRKLSSRPASRMNPEDELALPIPDLPPVRPAAATRQRVEVAPGVNRTGGAAVIAPVPLPAAPPAAAWRREDPAKPMVAPQVTLPLGAVGAMTTSAWQPPINRGISNDVQAQPVPRAPELPVPSLLGSLPRQNSTRPTLLIDVTPFSLCVETVSGYVDVLVARNTPVPCERSRDFVTAHDNQQSVIVRVAQGESKVFHENVLLGEVQLTGIPAAPRGQTRIAVTFGIDSDGILHVRALDVVTGHSALADLQLTGAPTPPEIAQMIARHAAKN